MPSSICGVHAVFSLAAPHPLLPSVEPAPLEHRIYQKARFRCPSISQHWQYQVCTEGKLDTLKEILASHPDWVNKRSDQGESCLHVAGILGQEEVTTAILKAGGDPNIRSTYEQGLRMHPLSWNVYHGHVC